MKKYLNVFLFLMLAFLSSCQAIGDIFKTGVGVGVFIVIAVIIIIFLVMRSFSKKS